MGNRTVNWAIVGTGDIVRKRVGPGILSQPDSHLRACVTRNPEAKTEVLDQLRPDCVYGDMQRMLADPDVHAVYLATPTFLHAPHAVAALRAGKDVIVEKPMALNAKEATDMCQTAQETGRRLAVAYYRRFWPRFQFVKDMLNQGKLGEVTLVRMFLHYWYDPAPDAPGAWRVRPQLSGGGVLSDVGSHRLDLLAWWLGAPKQLAAHVTTHLHSYEGEDSAGILMELDNGALVSGSFQWNSKTWADEIHIVGTAAKVALTPCDGEEVAITRGRETEIMTMAKPENAHYPLIDDFARSIVEARAPRFQGADGMRATQIMDAVFESSKRQQWKHPS